MLLLLSPAKSLDFETPTTVEPTRPVFMAEAAALIGQLRTQSPNQIAALMTLSDKLAALNVARYGAWRPRNTPVNSKPAVLAFNGDVYDGLAAPTLSSEDIAWAQDHVAILSGLYGVLRPLDALQPYRLEMGTRWANPRGKDLYAWWGDRIAKELLHRLSTRKARSAASGSPVIVNLASQEYAKAALRPALVQRTRVIECVFEDWKDTGYKIISFYAKQARGLMARHAITHRLDDPQALQGFDLGGYRFDATASAGDRWVFRRRAD
ncbi:peroxide stress protein YaaA [Sphaerotilus sp.]|uniref:peroxide stress protein YaaA n=1 Tax=Sphaerotilus sp. TaxID=2093942 RepID=UPI00286D8879|nr:peroxide stress protein YaaA [Sphaerotilus sp.]